MALRHEIGIGRRRARETIEPEARRSVTITVDGAVELYDRARHLPRLITIGPDEIKDDSPAARRAILTRLARALRAERNRGRAGHWTYDLNRHLGLKQAHAAERQRLGVAGRAERPVHNKRPLPEPGSGLS